MRAVVKRMIGAAIDIGSNSIKMTIGRARDDGGIEDLDWASEVVRLGEGLDRTGLLDEQRIEAAIETLRRFAAQARDRGATRIVGVATEATRAAANGATFLDRVRAETGIDVRVIDGQDEAALTFRGLQVSTDLTGSIVVADIGGGSTELISARDGVMTAARSLPLGSGRLTDRLVMADPPRLEEIAACEREASAVIQTLAAHELPSGETDRLIVVGGTGEYLARLLTNEAIDLDGVRTVLSRIVTLSAAELADEIDIPEARARVLPAGIAILAATASRLSPDQIEISRSGVRTGLLLQTLHGGEAHLQVEVAAASQPADTEADSGRTGNAEQVTDDDNFRDTMRALISERWRAVWEAIPVALEGEDIEGVHDVRVASRRLRAAMDVARPAFPGKWYKALHETAKRITGALGEVRDRDVLLEALRHDREGAPVVEYPGLDRLIDRVEGERAVARAEMERFLRQLLDGPLRSDLERRFGVTGLVVTERPAPAGGTT